VQGTITARQILSDAVQHGNMSATTCDWYAPEIVYQPEAGKHFPDEGGVSVKAIITVSDSYAHKMAVDTEEMKRRP
jgi:phosphopantetheinyl transferase (holo-ACP synthase)